ncbi:MAG: SDR family oxidoreductase [Gemmatimonadota bacterium]
MDPGVEGVPGSTRDGETRSLASQVEELLDQVETQPRPASLGGELRGRVAIVTGGSSGIGRAVALSLAAAGVDVAFTFLNDGDPRSALDAERTLDELERQGVRALCHPCDNRRPEEIRAFVPWVLGQMGGLHILVNNAGVGRDRALWRMEDEAWETVIATNLSGAFYFTREVAPHFREQEWGKIVNVSSVHAYRGEFGLANYASSKAGLLGLTRSAALELGPSNVNVNVVAPGYIRTTRLTEGVPPEILDRARDQSSLGRLGDPQDVANVVMFLCTEAARHITGAVIPVDGGYLL